MRRNKSKQFNVLPKRKKNVLEGRKRSVIRACSTRHLVSAQVIDQRLHVGEDTLGVRLLAHYHHVLHFQQGHTISKGPNGKRLEKGINRIIKCKKNIYRKLTGYTALRLFCTKLHYRIYDKAKSVNN